MVRTKGPLLSPAAAGALGGTLIFSNTKGRNYVKKWHQPSNPQTGAQLGMRAITQFISQWWANLPAADKQSWDNLAQQLNLPNMNACLNFNLQAWRRHELPCTLHPPNRVHTPNYWSQWNCSVVGRGIRHELISTFANAFGRGWFLYRGNSPVTRNWNNLVHCVVASGIGTWYYHDTPLAPGTYYYQAHAISDDGNLATVLDRGPYVVT